MMVHERPVTIHKGPVTLPNGEKVDFGNNVKNHRRKTSNNKRDQKKLPQSLPDGAKPVFEGKQDKKEKTNGVHDKINDEKKKNKKKDDAYAGTTFHSSPEALNLPKPTFKASPKLSNPVTSYPSPYHPVQPQGQPQVQPQSQPQFQSQGHPQSHPQQFPPMQAQSGPVPQAAPMYMPMMGMPMLHPALYPQSYPPQYPHYAIPQQMYPGPAPAYNSQKISFDELLGNSK